MQEIIVEKPYRFVPPHRGGWGPYLVQKLNLLDWYLSYFEGVTSHEVRHAERLRDSVQAGHGIILAPNHCRYADPLAIGWVASEVGVYLYAMASWHLFNQGRLQALAMQLVGGFSVYREGVDRASIDTAVEILTDGDRPLVIFPEGTVYRTNDRLNTLLDGVSFLARSAARRRAKADRGKVVIHPVAIKYLFGGDVAAAAEPVLKSMEERLTWHEPHTELGLLARIRRVGEGLLSLKEIQYLGAPQRGSLGQRKTLLIEHLLHPLENSILGSPQKGSLLPRIKQLRSRIVPQLTATDTDPQQKQKLWMQLTDIYIAQQIESYPEGYLDEATDTRALETVERFDEDLHDRARIHRPWHCILEVGEPIEADAAKPGKGESDPIMTQLEAQLSAMLHRLAKEARPLTDTPNQPVTDQSSCPLSSCRRSLSSSESRKAIMETDTAQRLEWQENEGRKIEARCRPAAAHCGLGEANIAIGSTARPPKLCCHRAV
jgi:hypothetical protein